jgi:outer membrane protein OmpA-like peptidoglycan-associated protein
MSSEGRPYIGSSNVEIAPVGQPQNSVIRTAPANMNARQPMTRPVASEASAYKGAALSSEPSAEDAAVRIFFDHGSSSLDEYGMQQLSQVLRNNQGMMLSVEGYASGRTASTNPVQSKQINLDMSMERAVAVANALIASGVPADHIRTVAWGEETNIANVQGMSVEEASRRVDVIPFRK